MIRTPASITAKILFYGNQAALRKRAGMSNGTYYNRKENPGMITLKELGPLAADLTDEVIIQIVRAWE